MNENTTEDIPNTQEPDRPYAGAAILSTFTPILVLVVSLVGRGIFPHTPNVRTVMMIFWVLCLAVGLIAGMGALNKARRADDPKYILRAGAGIFANAILLLFIGFSLLVMATQG